VVRKERERFARRGADTRFDTRFCLQIAGLKPSKPGTDARFASKSRQNVGIVVSPEPNGFRGSRVQIPPSRLSILALQS